MDEMILLGAGASVDAGVPHAYGMTESIVKQFRNDPSLEKYGHVVSFVIGGLLFEAGKNNEDPLNCGVNVEQLFSVQFCPFRGGIAAPSLRKPTVVYLGAVLTPEVDRRFVAPSSAALENQKSQPRFEAGLAQRGANQEIKPYFPKISRVRWSSRTPFRRNRAIVPAALAAMFAATSRSG